MSLGIDCTYNNDCRIAGYHNMYYIQLSLPDICCIYSNHYRNSSFQYMIFDIANLTLGDILNQRNNRH